MNYLYRLYQQAKNPNNPLDCKSFTAQAKSMTEALYIAREINSLLSEAVVYRVEEIASGDTEEL